MISLLIDVLFHYKEIYQVMVFIDVMYIGWNFIATHVL